MLLVAGITLSPKMLYKWCGWGRANIGIVVHQFKTSLTSDEQRSKTNLATEKQLGPTKVEAVLPSDRRVLVCTDDVGSLVVRCQRMYSLISSGPSA